MDYTTIIATDRLATHLQDADWLIVDCRFDLSKPRWGNEEYLKAHIPGAVFADLDRHLASPITPSSGRHPLPEPANWCETVTNWGITPDTQVIAYDSAGGSLAAVRVWWLLRAYGHHRVAVLDGGYPKWMRENRTVSTTVPNRTPAIFTGSLDLNCMVTSEQLVDLHHNPKMRLIDARAAERFRGEIEPIDPVAGHIPGAKNRPIAENMNPDQTFKSAAQLRAEFEDLFEEIPPQNAISYCGSGVTGIHNLLAMEIAGFTGGRLYPGSWSEWIRDPNRPVETGA
jgi:thiosulfate/3-mercaptopyruvate sulfurtransferase